MQRWNIFDNIQKFEFYVYLFIKVTVVQEFPLELNAHEVMIMLSLICRHINLYQIKRTDLNYLHICCMVYQRQSLKYLYPC